MKIKKKSIEEKEKSTSTANNNPSHNCQENSSAEKKRFDFNIIGLSRIKRIISLDD